MSVSVMGLPRGFSAEPEVTVAESRAARERQAVELLVMERELRRTHREYPHPSPYGRHPVPTPVAVWSEDLIEPFRAGVRAGLARPAPVAWSAEWAEVFRDAVRSGLARSGYGEP